MSDRIITGLTVGIGEFLGLLSPDREAGPLRTMGRPRHKLWPARRAQHLAVHPMCLACGYRGGSAKRELQVHHELPFHLFPDKELDPANLITLCQGVNDGCHLTFGHFKDWAKWNPTIRADAACYYQRLVCAGLGRSGVIGEDPPEGDDHDW
jgi:hypothetical protein